LTSTHRDTIVTYATLFRSVMVRQRVRALLESEKDFSIVGECGDRLETVKLVEWLKPDVLIMGLMLPSLNGLDVVCHIGQKSLPRSEEHTSELQSLRHLVCL